MNIKYYVPLIIIFLFFQANSQGLLSLDPVYTQDIALFKKDKYSIRLETIVGCWVISDNYIRNQIKTHEVSRKAKAQLVKICMKKINRKDAVVAITSLVGKNMIQVKKLEQFIDQQDQKINSLLNNLRQYRNKSSIHEKMFDLTLSEFDSYILSHIQKYQEQLNKMSHKGGVTNIVDQQLKKRTKYYFGFIPANLLTHTTLMITLSLAIVCCCTCYKYSKRRESISQNKKKKQLLRGISPMKASKNRFSRV